MTVAIVTFAAAYYLLLIMAGAEVADRKAGSPFLGGSLVFLLGPIGFVLCFFLPPKKHEKHLYSQQYIYNCRQ